MKVYDGERSLIDVSVATGTGGTPTPKGLFFLKELLPQKAGGALGPYAFGLSGYSEVLSSFAGGVGNIGIHGTNDPGKLGTNASHGCVRVDNVSISTMAKNLPLGTPVEVVEKASDAPANRRSVEWAFGTGATVAAAQGPTVEVQTTDSSTTTVPVTTLSPATTTP